MGRRIDHSAELSSLFLSSYEESDSFERCVSPDTELDSLSMDMTENPSWLVRDNSATELHFRPGWKQLSSWSRSRAKRLFDFACVLLSLPIVLPLMLVIGAVVRFSSPGPVLFLQSRVGLHGRIFKIFKFRTMTHVAGTAHHPIATPDSEGFTRVGPFLRRWKLDEVPQLLNVLFGQMSLVGPRPKMPEHVIFDLPCRPGITGMATTVFAREEKILACVPKDQVDDYYHSVVLPAKRQLDAEYMARATFKSDLRLLVNSVLRRWDTDVLDEILVVTAFRAKTIDAPPEAHSASRVVRRVPMPVRAEHSVNAEEVSAF
jgi:lipopolysaccharide/colanic/teichoic acid biosynthesis glycosyltransferase